MSRTRRLRHLPRVSTAYQTAPLKIGEAGFSKRSSKHTERIWDLGYAAGLSHTLIRHFEREFLAASPLPIGRLHDHPFVGHNGAGGRAANWYKRTGNRRVRRIAKVKVQHWVDDDFEDRLPDRNDGWDRWDLT